MTISAMFVAWSATRSRKREIRISRMARGLVQREQLDALLVHLEVVGVGLRVAVDDLLIQLAVPLDGGGHDPADLVLDEAAHGEQRLLERVELFVEVPLHGVLRLYPNRPVM